MCFHQRIVVLVHVHHMYACMSHHILPLTGPRLCKLGALWCGGGGLITLVPDPGIELWSSATFGASHEVGGCPQGKSKGCPQPRAKPAAKQTGLAVHAGAKAAPRAIASSSSASATHPMPVMQTEHVQQFKVCY